MTNAATDIATEIDLAGLPVTFAIIGALLIVIGVLRYFHEKFPQAIETFKDRTAWMNWLEADEDDYEYESRTVRYVRTPATWN